MRRLAVVLLTFVLLPGIVRAQEPPALKYEKLQKPRLSIKSRRIRHLLPGLAAKGFGVRYDFTALLEGELEQEGVNPETYYCLDEIWDWDDGTESVSEPDCDPFEEGTEIKKAFFDNHYFGLGEYTVTFLLMNADEIVLKAEWKILIK